MMMDASAERRLSEKLRQQQKDLDTTIALVTTLEAEVAACRAATSTVDLLVEHYGNKASATVTAYRLTPMTPRGSAWLLSGAGDITSILDNEGRLRYGVTTQDQMPEIVWDAICASLVVTSSGL